ncbi:MAG: 16S rRNA (uracil(1498)-N(3))-methyltransferase [Bacteroidetes bacterium]|nr:16S rRNA (uracil(1498)-N(3))-methyltransferase [Bacteroidota bacterium]
MNLFFAPSLQGNLFTLNEEESKHCIRVLRLKKGDLLHLTDGNGNLFETTIVDDNTKRCSVEIISVQKEYLKRDFYLHIAIAPTKNMGRFEWFLEKATEIGVDEITPLFCHYSERTYMKASRLEKILISAMKQSLKTYLPKLHDPVSFSDFIHQPFNGQKYIAYCDPSENRLLKDLYSKGENALILIGPEGDFSNEEVAEAKNTGFIPISLGKSRLRTETAGIVACNTINFVNQD